MLQVLGSSLSEVTFLIEIESHCISFSLGLGQHMGLLINSEWLRISDKAGKIAQHFFEQS